jgi:hypothetical protein
LNEKGETFHGSPQGMELQLKEPSTYPPPLKYRFSHSLRHRVLVSNFFVSDASSEGMQLAFIINSHAHMGLWIQHTSSEVSPPSRAHSAGQKNEFEKSRS